MCISNKMVLQKAMHYVTISHTYTLSYAHTYAHNRICKKQNAVKERKETK